MNTLHVRSIPDNLYRRLQELAKRRNRSLSAQVTEMLSQSLEEEELRLNQAAALTSIRRRRFTPPAEFPTSLELLHEDRGR
jgi:plasmid stability protein